MVKTAAKAKKTAPVRRLYTHDNLPVLRNMDSESVDLIYLDPPFNSGKNWERPIGGVGRKVNAAFKDTWTLGDIHADEEYALSEAYPEARDLIEALWYINGGSWKAYLIYMGARLVEMRRILKPAGSIYYHCDPVMSHGVKLLMDAIFGSGKTKSGKSGGGYACEITWCYTTPTAPNIKRFPYHYDNILWYTKGSSWRFNRSDIRVPYSGKGPHGGNAWLKEGKTLKEWREEKYKEGKIPSNWWADIPKAVYSSEKTDYPTQKPLALLERIIKASSNKGDLVLDPFCGCATTMVAAEYLGRSWVGIDVSEKAAEIVIERLQKTTHGEIPLLNPEDVVEHFRAPPKRTDLPKMTDKRILKPHLYKKQDGKCVAPCGKNGEGRKVDIGLMDFDHITARERGGQSVDGNMQLLCRECNSIKGAKGMTYLSRRILEKRTRENQEKWLETRTQKTKKWAAK
ncbi:MAG: DNA methyltransferase [Gammaproteobacteria bacterium]